MTRAEFNRLHLEEMKRRSAHHWKEADKRLRDAAPDLLAALQDIAERKGASLANFQEIQAVARAAIAKAEGVS